MIKLFDNWIIEIDSRNYVLAQVTGTTMLKTKDGGTVETDVKKYYGFYPGISEALSALGKELSREKLMDGVYTLTEALRAIRESNQQVADLLEQVKEDAGWQS